MIDCNICLLYTSRGGLAAARSAGDDQKAVGVLYHVHDALGNTQSFIVRHIKGHNPDDGGHGSSLAVSVHTEPGKTRQRKGEIVVPRFQKPLHIPVCQTVNLLNQLLRDIRQKMCIRDRDTNPPAQTLQYLAEHCAAPIFCDPVSTAKAEKIRPILGKLHTLKPVSYTHLAAVHLLFINLLTDSLPAIALGLEPQSEDVMLQKPRPRSEGILTKDFLTNVGVEGCVISLATIVAFHIGLSAGGADVYKRQPHGS